MRVCNKCLKEKPLDLFRKDSRLISGRAARCKSCQSLYTKEYSSKNKEKVLEYNKDYRCKNSETAKKRSADWRKNNPEKYRETKANTYKKHKEKFYARNALRRAQQYSLTPSWADKTKILKIYEECKRITLETGIKHHVDHIIPIRGKMVSGFHVEYNLRIIPAKENLKKNNRLDESLL